MKHGTQLDSNMLITKIIILVAVDCGASYKPENFQKTDAVYWRVAAGRPAGFSINSQLGIYKMSIIWLIDTANLIFTFMVKKIFCKAPRKFYSYL